MEIGRLEDIKNVQTNHIEKLKSVKEVDNKQKIVDNQDYKKVKSPDIATQINEVILDNVKFGYNKNSKDFFVKVIRGEAEYKYPTEDMMRMKSLLLNELKENNKL